MDSPSSEPRRPLRPWPYVQSWSLSVLIHAAVLVVLAVTVVSVPYALLQTSWMSGEMTEPLADIEPPTRSDGARVTQGVPDEELLPNEEILPEMMDIVSFNEAPAAPVHAETADFGLEHAPRNNLLNKMGSTTGSGFEGRGQAARQGMVASHGGAASAAQPGRARASFETAPAKPAGGAVRSWKRSQLVPNTSRLMVGDKEELKLEGMQVKVDVDGFRARVVLDCYYQNHLGRQLEGTFQLRLPSEATPFLFAFGETAYRAVEGSRELAFLGTEDVRGIRADYESLLAIRNPTWQGPKEARVVPRDIAAQSYFETVRRKVDPALVEWSGAGVFNCRVFPLFPSKLHRIVIGYDVDLTRIGNDWEYRLDLPELPARARTAAQPDEPKTDEPKTDEEKARSKPPLAVRCVVDVSVAGPLSAAPRVEILPTATAAQPAPDRGDGRTHYRLTDPKAEAVSIRIPARDALLLTGQDASGSYLAAAFEPRLPADEPGAAAGKRDARHAVFLLDVSLSSQPEKFAVWLALLRNILERNRDSIDGFAVVFFNIESFWWKREFSVNTPENVAALLTYCESLSLEGATDLGQALSEAASPEWLGGAKTAKRDLFLLSDAAATWGEDDPLALSARLRAADAGPLFGYSTGLPGGNARILGDLARATGGGVFSVVGEAEIPQAARAHRSAAWQIESVDLAGASDCQLAGHPRNLFAGQQLVLAARGQPTSSEVLLSVRRGDRLEVIRTVLAPAIRSPLVPRIYGQVSLGQLEEWRGETQAESVAYARHFRIPGQTCSLVMLESEADYKRFGIKPEDDAGVVQRSPVGATLARIHDSVRQALANPRASFVALLTRLRALPGTKLAFSPSLDALVADLPDEAFAPPAARVERRLRLAAALPQDYRGRLAAHKLDWDLVSKESQRRLSEGAPDDALVALSSLIEEQPGETAQTRAVAFAALEWRADGAAYGLLDRLARQRPAEPHSYLALARAAEQAGRPDLAFLWYEIALARGWDARFGDHHRVASLDALRFLRASRGRLSRVAQSMAAEREQSLAKAEPLAAADLVVVIEWNTDNTDVDLHVVDPRGEECFYSHPRTASGGVLSQDVTRGLGPEVFVAARAIRGRYRVGVHYFSQDANRWGSRTQVYATVFRGWGTPEETVVRRVVTLPAGKSVAEIDAVSIK